MLHLPSATRAWGTDNFTVVLKEELEDLDIDALPLQAGLTTSSYVTDDPHQVMIISVADQGDTIRVTAGIFYTGILAGCACADDPSPINDENEYCELRLDIHKQTSETTVVLHTP